MSLETLRTEVKQVEQSKSTKEINQFFRRHPILYATAAIWVGSAWLLRACLWTLVLFLAVVGLKVLWLAVKYMWGLV
jgi:hypothetical protein